MKSVALALALATAAAPASAQVAVAIASGDGDASQRNVAAAVVTAARARWQMLTPQLAATDVKSCKSGDTACLRAAAADAKATHLLVVGVAPLGVRDYVVAVQLFDVGVAAPLFEESAVQPGALDDLKEVNALANRLVAVPGPPPAPPLVPYAAQPSASNDLGSWTWAGFGLVAVAGATAATCGVVGALLIDRREAGAARDVFFYGFVASGALAAAGTAAFIVDEL